MGNHQPALHCGPTNLHPLSDTDHSWWAFRSVHHPAWWALLLCFHQARVKASNGILACVSFTGSDLCWECRESFLFQQQRDLREYTQATVYVRKVLEDKRVWTWAVRDLRQVFFSRIDVGFLRWAQTVKEAAPELTASSSEAEEEKEEQVKLDGEGDPDFGQVHTHTHTPLCWMCVSAVKPFIFLITIQIGISASKCFFFCSNFHKVSAKSSKNWKYQKAPNMFVFIYELC